MIGSQARASLLAAASSRSAGLDQASAPCASRSCSAVMEARAGMDDQRAAVADPPIAFTSIAHGPTRLFGELHAPRVEPHDLRLGENRLLKFMLPLLGVCDRGLGAAKKFTTRVSGRGLLKRCQQALSWT